MTASSEATVIAVGLSRTTLTVTGLENGRQYLFRVAAENEAGEGSWAEVTTIPIGRPLAPTSLVANVEDDAIVLTWSVPVNNGGMPVTGYVVLRRTASTDMLVLTQLGNVTRYVDRGARAGTTYHYAVRAVNAVGEGNASEPMQARIPGEGPMGLQGTGPIVPVVMAVAVAIGAAYWFVHRRRHQGEPLDAKPHDGSEE